MRKFRKALSFIKEICIWKYTYLNYFSSNVIRKGTGKIIPYKNVVIDLGKKSKIYVGDENLEIGTNKLKRSRAETYIRLHKKAVWKAEGGCNLAYGVTLEVLESAMLETLFFTMNSFSTIIVGNSIMIGNDVMIARNVTILDSDFHNITYNERKKSKYGEVKIEDHVWLAANVMILKNTRLGQGSIVSANTLITSGTKINEKVIIGNEKKIFVLHNDIEWTR